MWENFIIRDFDQRQNYTPSMLSLVSFAGMTLNKCAVLRIGTLTGGPLCRENHPLCMFKNPTVVYMITCRLSSCKTGVYNVRLLIILERGCSSMFRKKESTCIMIHQRGMPNGLVFLSFSRYCMMAGVGVTHISYWKQVAQRATITHLIPMCQGQISFKKKKNKQKTKNKKKTKKKQPYKWAMETRGPKSTHPSFFMPVLVTSNFAGDSIKNEWDTIFPL